MLIKKNRLTCVWGVEILKLEALDNRNGASSVKWTLVSVSDGGRESGGCSLQDGLDSHDTHTHGNSNANLFSPPHPEVPEERPGERGENKVTGRRVC